MFGMTGRSFLMLLIWKENLKRKQTPAEPHLEEQSFAMIGQGEEGNTGKKREREEEIKPKLIIECRVIYKHIESEKKCIM